MNKNKLEDLFNRHAREYNIPFVKVRNNSNKKGDYSFDIKNNIISLNFKKSDENDIKNSILQYRSYASVPIYTRDHLFTFMKELGTYMLIDVKHPEDEGKCPIKISHKFINNLLVSHGYKEGKIEA